MWSRLGRRVLAQGLVGARQLWWRTGLVVPVRALQRPGRVAVVAGAGLVLLAGRGDPASLLRAVRDGRVGEVGRLVESGADPGARHPLGWSPLHLAAVWGRQEILSLLLNAGAAVDAEDEFSNVYTRYCVFTVVQIQL